MKLLTLNEWMGPDHSGHVPGFPRERLISMATNMPLGQALRKLRKYQEDFKVKHAAVVVNFRLVSVAEIETTEKGTLAFFDVDLIEELGKE